MLNRSYTFCAFRAAFFYTCTIISTVIRECIRNHFMEILLTLYEIFWNFIGTVICYDYIDKIFSDFKNI